MSSSVESFSGCHDRSSRASDDSGEVATMRVSAIICDSTNSLELRSRMCKLELILCVRLTTTSHCRPSSLEARLSEPRLWLWIESARYVRSVWLSEQLLRSSSFRPRSRPDSSVSRASPMQLCARLSLNIQQRYTATRTRDSALVIPILDSLPSFLLRPLKSTRLLIINPILQLPFIPFLIISISFLQFLRFIYLFNSVTNDQAKFRIAFYLLT